MIDKAEIFQKLTAKEEKSSFEFFKSVCTESAESDKYLCMIPEFVQMLGSKNSYIRTRGFGLICAQARWAAEGQIEAVFDKMITILADSKPITVRQALGALHEVVLYRPELVEKIRTAVEAIDLSRYKDSMSPLIKKDADELLGLIG